jgi:cytochrome c oxidase subunit 4
MPETITREWQVAQLELMVKQRQGAVDGVSSNWDYENNRWK